jgi:enoyl-CoA hydratase/carnithine racemase
LEVLEGDREVRIVVISGAGKAFCAGADIKERVEYENQVEMQLSLGGPLFRRIEKSGKIFIAAMHGYAVGGGLELAMACDIRMASEDCQLGQPEVNLGIIPGSGGTQRLPRLIGLARAKELMFTGRLILSKQAHDWGLVNRVVPKDDLMTEALKLAEELATKAPFPLQLIKSAVEFGIGTDLESGLAYEQTCTRMVNATADRKEGMRAFVEKRSAVFRGA